MREIGYHGGKVKVSRPRVRDRAGKEVSLESWQVLRTRSWRPVARVGAQPDGPERVDPQVPASRTQAAIMALRHGWTED